jgi:hypothetical protein
MVNYTNRYGWLKLDGGKDRKGGFSMEKSEILAKKSIALVLLLSFAVMLMSGCVSAPKYSDYAGLEKHDAQSALQKKKTSNGIKLACNWLLWGWVGLWIPSVVDTIRVLSFMGEFDTIQARISSTPNGGRVGQAEVGPSGSQQTSATVPPAAPAIQYSVMLNGQQMGPYNYSQLVQMASSRQLTAQTLVWRTGMAAWVEAGTVPELAQILASNAPPPPPMQ